MINDKFMRVIFDTAHDAIIVIDSEGIIQNWNNGAVAMFEFSEDEVVGKAIHDLIIPDEYKDAHLTGLHGFAKTGSGPAIGKTLSLKALTKTGVTIPVELSLSSASHEGRWYAVGTIRDITERVEARSSLERTRESLEAEVDARTSELAEANRKLEEEIAERTQAQKSLAMEKRRLEDVTVHANSGLLLLDSETRVTYANPLIEEWFGPFDELKGRKCSDVFGLTDPQKQCAGLKVLRTGDTASGGNFIRTVHDQKMYLYAIASPIKDESDNIQQITEIVFDITDQKKAESKLAKTAEELRRSNKDLQQFAFMASHDLQEPLRVASSYIQLLAERYKGQMDSDADDFIWFAEDAIRRMQKMIDDLLAYSRVGTRGHPFEVVDFDEVVGGALANLQISIEESDAEIERGELPALMGDASQLQQLFQNLIGNAIKFRGDQRPHVQIAAIEKEAEWHISITDNGIGIDAKNADRIFEIFQTLHSREEYPGTGIGLAICKKIVERHGGRIWMESELGRGSTCIFTIPTKMEASQ